MTQKSQRQQESSSSNISMDKGDMSSNGSRVKQGATLDSGRQAP